MIKQVMLAMSLVLAACSGSTVKPIPPPPTEVSVADAGTPPEVKVVEAPKVSAISATLKTYTNSTGEWTVGMPDNLTLVAQTDDEVKMKADDGSVFQFIRQSQAGDLETFTGTLIMAMNKYKPSIVEETQIGKWPASVVIYERTSGVMAFVLVSTDIHWYACIYAGYNNTDRFHTYKSIVESIQINDKPVVKAATKAKPAKK